MIRRETPRHLVLIAQHDHAVLAGELARRMGNTLFGMPSPFDSVITAISQHDCGWIPRDRAPELSSAGLPAHVFEINILTALDAWSDSTDQVAAGDPYAGLLVSMHSMALASRYAAREPEANDERSRQVAFRVRRFIHRQIEVQESLRRRLQMSIDQPLRGGLAEIGRAAEEDLLRANFFLLEFVDQLSLNLCFDRLVFEKIETVYPRAGEPSLSIRIFRNADGTVRLDSWPFNEERLELNVDAKRIAPGPYRNAEHLKSVCESAERVKLRLLLRPASG
jgi:hypothetical protein